MLAGRRPDSEPAGSAWRCLTDCATWSGYSSTAALSTNSAIDVMDHRRKLRPLPEKPDIKIGFVAS